MNPLTRILKSINNKSEKLDREFIEAEYSPFIVQKIMSAFPDAHRVMMQMEIYRFDEYHHYLYWYTYLPRANRYAPMPKNPSLKAVAKKLRVDEHEARHYIPIFERL